MTQGNYAITIENCNSIAEARLSLRRSSLNIKYGPNGIGKSTIAQSLVLRAQGDMALAGLRPFKYRIGTGHPDTSVAGAEALRTVLVFDETYVSQFAFQPDEVLKNSFEIFINTDEYKRGLEELNTMFEGLKDTFTKHHDLEGALASFTDLRDAFGVTNTGAIAKTSRGFKALSVGGKLENIPEPLRGYQGFLHSDDPAGWITWQSRGKSYLELSDNCPFCSIASVNKETAKKVSEVYETAAVKNMSALRIAIDRLGHYFEPSFLSQLNRLMGQIGGLSLEQGQFLVNLRSEVQTFLDKLTVLRHLSFHVLHEEDNIGDLLRNLKIDLSLLRSLNSETTRSFVELINEKLDGVAGQINDIRARIGKHKTSVAKGIRAHQDDINEFLASAGYRYCVRVEPNLDSYRMILEHKDAPGHVGAASRHLSYGERNAFALVLFMHHVRRDRPDLVILDDPVSSFDKTKKYAILHRLFRGHNSLNGFTTLLLTHDIEPAIDIVRIGTSSQFSAAQPVVHFLSSKSGIVEEKPIEKGDISTFSQICDANISDSSDDIIKCIYLRRRYEVHGALGVEYHVLSSLLHLRDRPDRPTIVGVREELTSGDVVIATQSIREAIPSFDYAALLRELRDPEKVRIKFAATNVGYEKVQLFRLMSQLVPGGLVGNKAFQKFVNESFHIENEYVMQLNPRVFEAVPEYVVEACTKLVNGVERS